MKYLYGLLRRAAPLFPFALALSLATASVSARAEGHLRIAQQFGVVYLLLDVARDQQFIEKEGKKLGVDIHPEWLALSGGAAINDALLSDSVDIAGAGVGPLMTIWDRTYGHQNVKAIASLGNFPYYLIANNPRIKTIADIGEQDRIALPAVTVSVQSRILQMAAAKQWGDPQFNRLDKYTQALPHPDAAAAIISGRNGIDLHFANPPFQEQELARNPAAHIVLNSYDVLGGPSSATLLYTTEKFRQANPKTVAAFVAALQDAAQYIQHDPGAAADAWLRVNHSHLDRALLLSVIQSPHVQFRIVPQNTLPIAQFMHRVGAIRHAPASWQDYFFADPHISGGS